MDALTKIQMECRKRIYVPFRNDTKTPIISCTKTQTYLLTMKQRNVMMAIKI